MNRLPKALWTALIAGVLLAGWSLASPGAAAGAGPALAVGATLAAVLLCGISWHLGAREQQTRPRSESYGDRMQVLQTLRLTPRHAIHTVRFESTIFLVGTGEGPPTVLQPGAEPPIDPIVSGEASAAGVDLRDTPKTTEEYQAPTPRSLADKTATGSTPRNALNAAHLADFRSRLSAARSGV